MDELYRTAKDYLKNHNVLSLATCNGLQPWVAPVFYAVHADKLVFLSAPHTRHCKNLTANTFVAGSIQEDYSDWSEIKGFQLQGQVQQVSSERLSDCIAAYSKKFPVTGVHAPAEISEALARILWFELTVQQIHFVDNSRGLGHRDELVPERLFGF